MKVRRVVGMVLVLALAASVAEAGVTPGRVFLPMVVANGTVVSGCVIPDPLPDQEVESVEVPDAGVKLLFYSECDPDIHVQVRVFHRGTQCPSGCYTVWAGVTEGVFGVPRVTAWPGVLRINEFVETWSRLYVPYEVTVLPYDG